MMKFSEALTEYLSLREQERDESRIVPIDQLRQRDERVQYLLDLMDLMTDTL